MLGDDVDHPVHGVGAPQRRAGAANHLDPLHVLQHRVLHVPIHPREQGCIHAPPVHQHQKLVGKSPVEAAGANCPLARVEPRHVDPRNHAQRFGDGAGARSPDVLLCNDVDGSRRPGQLLFLLGCGGDLDVHQILNILTDQVGRAGLRLQGDGPQQPQPAVLDWNWHEKETAGFGDLSFSFLSAKGRWS